MSQFLPISKEELERDGIEALDFVYVIGDAYVDHPSFGHAVISRVLEDAGYTVGIISQPDWRNPDSVRTLGRPRLGFLVTSGNMDSMVNHYAVSKKRRTSDAYTPGGIMGKRPDYAVTVYTRLLKNAWPDVPVIIGGIEASLRRLAHYDYWSDRLKQSVLLESGADLLIYGMGERQIVEVAQGLADGIPIEALQDIRGTVYWSENLPAGRDLILLPSYEELLADKKAYATSFYTQYVNTDPFHGKRLAEPYKNGYIIQNKPAKPLDQDEMDHVYGLPYARRCHPELEKQGKIAAIEEVAFSLVSNRGCFGGCSFCALTFHQGRIVQSRSHDSILGEAELLTKQEEFKGYIHDVGGPTANFRHPACKKQLRAGACPKQQCLFPQPCQNLVADHTDYVSLLRKLRNLPGVKKVFIRSGIRFDYLLLDKDGTFFRELCDHHISGQLKVAPEHISGNVLEKMGKPPREVYDRFVQKFKAYHQKTGKKQYLVPYLMSSHPGSTLKEAVALAEYLRDQGLHPQQVQDFYPTPSTLSTCMYYTGIDPRSGEAVYVPKNPHEKAMQRALIQYGNPKNRELVAEALHRAGREDLIGYGKNCLIRPRQGEGDQAGRRDFTGSGKISQIHSRHGEGVHAGRRDSVGSGKSGQMNPRQGEGFHAGQRDSIESGKSGSVRPKTGKGTQSGRGGFTGSGKTSQIRSRQGDESQKKKKKTIRNVHKSPKQKNQEGKA